MDLIDVKKLIDRYSIDQLNESAENYYRSAVPAALFRKPFRLPEMKHLLTEVSYLCYGLDLLPGDTVLDFGCGVGWSTRILAACGCNVVGVDVSNTALDLAASMTRQWASAELGFDGTIEFRRYDGKTLPIETGSIDKVFVLDAFHHVPDQIATLRELGRVLRPGGVAGFCEPGPNHSKHPLSQQEMRMHTVIENDIVLAEIRANAETSGFADLRVCLSPMLPMMASFDEYQNFPAEDDIRNRFLNATDWRVKNYPIFFMTKAGIAPRDSRDTNGLSCKLQLQTDTPVTFSQDAVSEVRFSAMNDGSATWLKSGVASGAVNVGYEIIDVSGAAKMYFSHLSSSTTAPGDTVDFVVRIPDLSRGKYSMRVDLVSSEIAWFNTLVGSEITFDVIVY